MKMKIRPTAVVYTIFVAVISSLITVLFYHVFVFNSFSTDSGQPSALRQIETDKVASSPIKQNKSIVEVLSYGCHYCAANEENVEQFAKTLPAGSSFEVIHITAERNGLAVYAPVFATLQEMGIEKKLRDQAYGAVIAKNINLADEQMLNNWLQKNNIDIKEYDKVSQSQAVKDRLDYMASVTKFYNINATPMFIVDKKFVVAQDRAFPEFAESMRQLLTHDDKE